MRVIRSKRMISPRPLAHSLIQSILRIQDSSSQEPGTEGLLRLIFPQEKQLISLQKMLLSRTSSAFQAIRSTSIPAMGSTDQGSFQNLQWKVILKVLISLLTISLSQAIPKRRQPARSVHQTQGKHPGISMRIPPGTLMEKEQMPQ